MYFYVNWQMGTDLNLSLLQSEILLKSWNSATSPQICCRTTLQNLTVQTIQLLGNAGQNNLHTTH